MADTILDIDIRPMANSVLSVAIAIATALHDREQVPHDRQRIVDICLNFAETVRSAGLEVLTLAAGGAGEQTVIAHPSERYLALVSALAADRDFHRGQINLEFVSHWPVLSTVEALHASQKVAS